ncbi:MAG: glycosyltransferase family 87 protein [Caulobacteraceae bacterium]
MGAPATKAPLPAGRPDGSSRALALEPPLAILLPAVAAALYGWAIFLSTFGYPGVIGPNYNAPGTDWMVMYEAARSALLGHLPLIFDGDRFTAHLNAVFSGWLSYPLPFRPWVYPPSFLLILAPFSRLGFPGSYAAFQAIGAALLAAALWRGADRPQAARWIALAALIGPAASINVLQGQCAFLVAALLVWSFRLIRTRPIVAGILLGILSFKPQFCLLLPVALIAMRQWRGLFAAGVTVLLSIVISAAVFGPQTWIDWLRQTQQGYFGGELKWIEYGRIWGNSVYACAVLLGATAKIGSIVQTASILFSAAAIWMTFRSRLQPDLKLAALLAATVLAAPHSAGYDGVLVVIAAGMWLAAQPGPRPLWQWTVALVMWLDGLFSPPLVFPPGRLMPLFIAGFVVLLAAKAIESRREASSQLAGHGQAAPNQV